MSKSLCQFVSGLRVWQCISSRWNGLLSGLPVWIGLQWDPCDADDHREGMGFEHGQEPQDNFRDFRTMFERGPFSNRPSQGVASQTERP